MLKVNLILIIESDANNADKPNSSLSSNILNLIPEKNSKNKIFKLHQPKKFNSLKLEKTPEKIITIINYLEKNNVNVKFRASATSLAITPLTTANIPNNNQNTFNINFKKKQDPPKVEMSITSNKSDPKKSIQVENTTSATEKSELHTISDNNMNNFLNESNYFPFKNTEQSNFTTITSNNANPQPNYVYSHYNKSLNNYKSSMFNFSHNEITLKDKNSLTNDYSIKIIDLLDKMRNFLSITCNDPALLIHKKTDNYPNLSTNFDGLFPSSATHLKKNLSVDFDLLSNKFSLEYMNLNSTQTQDQKINLFFKEIEGIYTGSVSLNERVKSTMFSTIENNNEYYTYESTKQNINQINTSSERVILLYKKLFDICGECLNSIKTIILDSADNKENQDNDGRVEKDVKYAKQNVKQEENKNFIKENFNIEKLFIENIIKNNLSKNEEKNEIKSAIKNNLSDKKKLINEKIEKLKCLKERKEQILNQKAVKFEESIVKSSHKLPRTNTNQTEIDPSESILNENALVKIPASNICEVNKPTNENNNYKLYTEEDSFQGDSQIILNFGDFNNDLKKENNIDFEKEFFVENIEKTINDTIIETGNSYIRSHRRSRSQLIQKQLSSYSVKPQ